MGPLCGSIILCLGPTICQNCPAAPTQTTQVKNYLWKHRGFLQNYRKPWKKQWCYGAPLWKHHTVPRPRHMQGLSCCTKASPYARTVLLHQHRPPRLRISCGSTEDSCKIVENHGKNNDAMGPLCGSIILCLGLAICQDCPAAPTQTIQVENYLWRHRGCLQNWGKPLSFFFLLCGVRGPVSLPSQVVCMALQVLEILEPTGPRHTCTNAGKKHHKKCKKIKKYVACAYVFAPKQQNCSP